MRTSAMITAAEMMNITESRGMEVARPAGAAAGSGRCGVCRHRLFQHRN